MFKTIPLIMVITIFPGCKLSTHESGPVPIDCAAGFDICESDSSLCCQVICDNHYHNCGEQLTDCCLDTTSHDFTFQVDTIGDYGSYINDASIVNENTIWVVGRIIDDSNYFNAAFWNGNSWE